MEISIIIPVYNKILYIEKILKQIEAQTFRDFECLLIDDGSTDGSGRVCDIFAGRDSRFICFHIPNGGVSHARNVGLDAAKGNYITFIDADDEIDEQYLENLYQCMLTTKADVVIGSYASIWDDSVDIVAASNPVAAGLYHVRDILPSFAEIQRNYGLYGWCWSKLIKRDIIQSIRFDEIIRLAEDFDFYLKVYEKIETIYFDEKPLYFYRQAAENNSVTSDDYKIDYLTQLKINLRYRNFLHKKDVWSGNNKKICERIISDYVYFVLFYAPLTKFNDVFINLSELCEKECIRVLPNGVLQTIMLSSLKCRKKEIAKFTLIIYRKLRKMVKKHE